MGCYGIGMERILTAAIEQSHDEEGFWLPLSIAPFDVVVTPTNTKDAILGPASRVIAETLAKAGFDVLYDDRDDRPAEKFKDTDLIGLHFRITVSKKVSEVNDEVFHRSTRE